VFAVTCLQRAIPVREVDIDRPYFNAMFAGIAHQLGRSIKAHRLRIEDGREDANAVAAPPAMGSV
jgi:hypothetical protein